jgi:hypothetical protein
MNRDYDVWIVGGHNDTHQITANVAKIARVTTRIKVHLRRVQDHVDDLALAPSFPAHFVLRVMSESHPALRAERTTSLPLLGARNADFEISPVDLRGSAVRVAVVGDGGGEDLACQVVLVGLGGG